MGWFHAAYAAGEFDGVDVEGCGGTCSLPPKKVQVPPCPRTLTGLETIYHMCERAHWDEAVEERGAYFPPTFHKDGKFTRASVFKEGLIDTANHFYKESPGDWICLELNLKLMLDMGIVIIPQAEENADVDEDGKEEKDDADIPVQCLQVYSGISTVINGLVRKIHTMKRSPCGSGTFLALECPTAFKAKRHPTVPRESTPKTTQQDPTRVPGVGSVPAKSVGPKKEKKKPEQQPAAEPIKKSKSGFGRMFGKKK